MFAHRLTLACIGVYWRTLAYVGVQHRRIYECINVATQAATGLHLSTQLMVQKKMATWADGTVGTQWRHSREIALPHHLDHEYTLAKTIFSERFVQSALVLELLTPEQIPIFSERFVQSAFELFILHSQQVVGLCAQKAFSWFADEFSCDST